MRIERKVVLLSTLAIFVLTPGVYSKDFSHKIKEFRTNFLDRKVRKGKFACKYLAGRTASGIINVGNKVEGGVRKGVRGAKGASSNFAASRRRRGEAAGRLWVATSSFNPALHDSLYSHWDNEKGEMTPLTIHNKLDNKFNSIRKQGTGDTPQKQFGNGVLNSWRRMFPKKQEIKPGAPQINATSPKFNETSKSLPEDDIKNLEVISASTVNDTADKQSDISNFSNEKIIKGLKEKRSIPFVKNQTLGDLIVYTEIAPKDDPKNGQVLCVVNKDSGFAVEYKDAEPFVIIFDDGRKSVLLNIDEDSDAGFLKVRDSDGIIYDYREKYVEGSKIITIENPLPGEFSKYLDKNGGNFKKEGGDEYYHVDKHGENKKLVFKKEESSRGLFYVIYDSDSSEGILKPKSAISANGKETITFSEVDKDIMVDSDGVEWSTYPLYYYSGEEDKRVDYISLSEKAW